MAVQKPKYELSIWNEELIDGIKVEKQGIIIGGHDMTHLGRAVNVRLKREVKGKNTLTFQMPTKFFNSEIGDFVKNELIEDLYNERKIKLHHITRNEWYEFYIKEISEEKQYKAIMKTFTCTDSFIDELSRTGYEKEFSPDLNNSVQEVGDFTEEILDGSIWDYRPEYNWGDFTEYREERFYKIPLSQFGGSISAYPINLGIKDIDELHHSSDHSTGASIPEIQNIHTYERREMEYGDDLARTCDLYWDNYQYDNGRELITDSNLVTLTSDYIYVPMTDLSFIQGSLYDNPLYAVETPAYYGDYTDKRTDFALQPTSQNPEDLIQFICFQDGDMVLTDEVNTLINNDCHYVITIAQWNNLLKSQFPSNKGCIYWTAPAAEQNENNVLNPQYNPIQVNDTYYSTKITPYTSVIDNFNWYPVYYEGYLNKIGDQEIVYARKISITDRTELNVNHNIYTKVYKNNAIEYKNLFSEDEITKEILARQNKNNQFRVVSKPDTYQILPTLARNLVQNGNNITQAVGWEAKTQNNNDLEILGTGSFKRLLELNVKSINENGELVDTDNLLGDSTDEHITDYYLEFLSPIVDKTDDFSLEGKVYGDYAINFGIVGQEKIIEKGKIYAIRLRTGQWIANTQTGKSEFIKSYNIDLDKILIGSGSVNSQGNYIVEGIDSGNDYIDFSTDLTQLTFIPTDSTLPSGSYVSQPLYRVKTNNEWTWQTTAPAQGDFVEDNAFVLFKAPKTIKNPYITIKVDSKPLEIQASNISTTEYSLNDGSGIRINAVVAKDGQDLSNLSQELLTNFNFAAGQTIKLYDVSPVNFVEDTFLARYGYDEETGYLNNVTENTIIELRDGDMKTDNLVFETTETSVAMPLYCKTFRGPTSVNDKKSLAKAIFVNDTFYGLMWLEK